MSTPTTPPDTSFNIRYILAELKRSEAAPIVALFEASMTLAGFSVTDPDNITPEIVSSHLAQARAKHAARSS